MLRGLVTLTLLMMAGGANGAAALTLHSLHTDERFELLPEASGRWAPAALATARHGLRDHRNGLEHEIDPGLLDLLLALAAGCGREPRFEVISGYRSPETNDMLCENSSGVARNSMHLYGKAIDIRLPGRNLRNVRNVALHLKRGGVGYYPESDFVHVDTGPVRHW